MSFRLVLATFKSVIGDSVVGVGDSVLGVFGVPELSSPPL